MTIKKLLLVLALCSSAWATTTVSGNVKNLGTGVVSTGSFIRFYLRGCAGNQPRINGTALIAPTLGNVFYFDFVPNSSGVISGTLYSSRDSTGLLGGDIECGGSTTAVWYGMVAFLNGRAGPETAIHAKNTATIDISNVTAITTNPVITAPTGDSTYARLDGGNQNFTGNIGAPGVNGALNASQQTGSDICVKVNAAETALPAAGGEILIPAGSYSSIATTCALTKPTYLHCVSPGNPQPGSAPCLLSFNSGVTGITLLNNQAQLSKIEGLYLLSASTSLGTDDGIQNQSNSVKITNVTIDHFGRDGISTDTSVQGNANLSTYYGVRSVNNKRRGYFTHGSNSNQIQFISVSAVTNTDRGYYDDASNNTYVGAHADGNIAGAWYLNGTSTTIGPGTYCESTSSPAATFDNTANNIRFYNSFFAPCTVSNTGTNAPQNRIEFSTQAQGPGWSRLSINGEPGIASPTVYLFSSGIFNTSQLALGDQTNSQNIFAYNPTTKLFTFQNPVQLQPASGTVNPTGSASGLFYRSDTNRLQWFDTAWRVAVGQDTTDTLTNKTYNTAGTGNVFQISGTTIGSGAPSELQMGCNGTSSANTVLFLTGTGGAMPTCSDTTGNSRYVITAAGTVKNLFCSALSGGVNASSGNMTITQNGSNSTVTCTFGTGTTCNDTTHSFAVVAGDLLRIKFGTQAAETLANVQCGFDKF